MASSELKWLTVHTVRNDPSWPLLLMLTFELVKSATSMPANPTTAGRSGVDVAEVVGDVADGTVEDGIVVDGTVEDDAVDGGSVEGGGFGPGAEAVGPGPFVVAEGAVVGAGGSSPTGDDSAGTGGVTEVDPIGAPSPGLASVEDERGVGSHVASSSMPGSDVSSSKASSDGPASSVVGEASMSPPSEPLVASASPASRPKDATTAILSLREYGPMDLLTAAHPWVLSTTGKLRGLTPSGCEVRGCCRGDRAGC